MSRDDGRIISSSHPTPLLMGRVWFNYNRVFNGFGLTILGFLVGLSLFSQIRYEFEAGSGIVTPVLPRLYF